MSACALNQPFYRALISSDFKMAHSNFLLKSHIASRISRKVTDVRALSACPKAKMLLFRRYLMIVGSESLCCLRGQRLRRLLSVGRVKLAQIARDALLQLGTPPFHLRPREVRIPVVHGLELAAVDGNTRRHEEAHLAAEFDEARTYLAQRRAIVCAEVVIRYEPTQQPHDLDIAFGFAFEPPARLNPVQIAVNVKENRGVVRWPTSRRRLHPLKAHLSQIECIDKHVDHASRLLSSMKSSRHSGNSVHCPRSASSTNPPPKTRFPANSVVPACRFQIPNPRLGNSSRTTKEAGRRLWLLDGVS